MDVEVPRPIAVVVERRGRKGLVPVVLSSRVEAWATRVLYATHGGDPSIAGRLPRLCA